MTMRAGEAELVVFDWDGTLVDSTGAIAQAIRGAARDLGLPVPSPEAASHVIGLGLADALSYAVPMLESRRIPEFVDRYRAHFMRRDGDLAPFDGIVGLLDALASSNAWIAVATGKSRSGLQRALHDLGWEQRFIATRTADEGSPKPHPWMLEDLCSELGIAPSRTLMIGDTTHDLGMARAAGVAAIGVTYGAHSRALLASLPALALVDTVDALSERVLALV